jgi:hypothetical protein
MRRAEGTVAAELSRQRYLVECEARVGVALSESASRPSHDGTASIPINNNHLLGD